MTVSPRNNTQKQPLLLKPQSLPVSPPQTICLFSLVAAISAAPQSLHSHRGLPAHHAATVHTGFNSQLHGVSTAGLPSHRGLTAHSVGAVHAGFPSHHGHGVHPVRSVHGVHPVSTVHGVHSGVRSHGGLVRHPIGTALAVRSIDGLTGRVHALNGFGSHVRGRPFATHHA